MRSQKSLNCSRISQNSIEPNVHYRAHKSLPPFYVLCLMNPLHTTTSYLYKIYLNVTFLLRPNLSSSFLHPALPMKTFYALHFSPTRSICPAHLILDFSFLLIFVEDTGYAALSNLPSLHLPMVQIFSSALCSRTPSVYVPPSPSRIKFYTHTNLHAKIIANKYYPNSICS